MLTRLQNRLQRLEQRNLQRQAPRLVVLTESSVGRLMPLSFGDGAPGDTVPLPSAYREQQPGEDAGCYLNDLQTRGLRVLVLPLPAARPVET